MHYSCACHFNNLVALMVLKVSFFRSNLKVFFLSKRETLSSTFGWIFHHSFLSISGQVFGKLFFVSTLFRIFLSLSPQNCSHFLRWHSRVYYIFTADKWTYIPILEWNSINSHDILLTTSIYGWLGEVRLEWYNTQSIITL